MSDSIITLTGLAPRPGASDAEIDSAERELGVHLPEDYRAFLLESDGIEGFSGPDGDYLMLWGATELVENNRGYEVSESAPGLTLIGSDGGGNAFGFVRQSSDRVVYVRTPSMDFGLAQSQAMGGTLFQFVRRLGGERPS